MKSYFLPTITDPSAKPEYRSQSEKVFRDQVVRRSASELIDVVATILANIAAIWFTVLVLIHGVSEWQTLGYLIVFWALLAYVVLPRWHKTLTTLYVPDYYIGRTRTQDGLLGDPINLAVIGSEANIHEAMQAAGWTLADPITLKSSWKIVVSSLRGTSYPEAPVSPLFLFKRQQAFAYQQEVEGNPAQRHHVRFWRCPEGWLLPGGVRVDWLAGGTYDRSVGLSLFTLQVTHKIDRNVDIERDYIIDSVRHANPEIPVEILPQFTTSYHHRNGGGDMIETDGALPILHVGDDAQPPPPAPEPTAPVMLWVTLAMVIFSFVLSLIGLGLFLVVSTMDNVPDWITSDSDLSIMASSTSVLIFLIQALSLWGCLGIFKGYQRARVALLTINLLSAIGGLAQLSAGNEILNLPSISLMLLNLFIVLTLSSDSIRTYVDHRSAIRHKKPDVD